MASAEFPSRRMRWWLAAAAGATLWIASLALLTSPGRSAAGPRIPVLVVGGSAAAGWRDGTGPGYVARGLIRYARRAGLTLRIANQAIPGARVVNRLTQRDLAAWIRRPTPHRLVVLAWGILNDLRHHTPAPAMARALHRQIETALAAHAVVLVVTPAVTRASFEEDRLAEPAAVRQELAVAQSFHSSRPSRPSRPSYVYEVNVFGAMKQYLAVHHVAYHRLMAGRWHPNTAGHRLAGRLLAQALVTLWGPPAGPPPALAPPPPRPAGRAAALMGPA
ncbi:MAG: SGNH/GDSL hydrolase family protein [Thermaerobacter sp.]|nr:SGNH/GDSL hydrolase family protein [Thermaerobacter sp.]